MKKTALLFYLLISTVSFSQRVQKLDEYKASNGVVYKKGDIITMNIGSAHNGGFVYLTVGGWTPSSFQIPSSFAGAPVKVKKIKKYKVKGVEKVLFTVGGGNITNYVLDIEPAIQVCEVTPCKAKDGKHSSSKYDELKKLKELLDSRVINEEEFEIEKKKILGS